MLAWRSTEPNHLMQLMHLTTIWQDGEVTRPDLWSFWGNLAQTQSMLCLRMPQHEHCRLECICMRSTLLVISLLEVITVNVQSWFSCEQKRNVYLTIWIQLYTCHMFFRWRSIIGLPYLKHYMEVTLQEEIQMYKATDFRIFIWFVHITIDWT